MAQHTEEHAEVLRGLLLGDRHADDPHVATLLATCPECEVEWSELQALQGDLGTLGQSERDLLAEAHTLTGTPGEELVARDAQARALRAAEPERASWRPRIRPGWGAAAALLIAAALFLFGDPGEETDPAGADDPFTIGTGSEAGLSPSGSVGGFPATFTWELATGDGGWYTVTVWADPGDGPLDEPLTTSERCRTQRWTPTEAQAAAWPRAILWEVRAFDASGSVVGSAGATAERSRP